ncbi:MAG TPA: Hsp20/alpha crystallin family protein [Candidatus Absconditabacterales bacterium]|nr:Hsp20/alpha crystallin family protein [Candidatus Absconditabacterales bacterium]HMT26752.1 Hsp20/alpha crystallin family protein [Candidatus Absconditabacterales bacterium]
MEEIQIPFDVYESTKEIVLVIPLGGVEKKSIKLEFEDYKLILSGERKSPKLKEDFQALKQDVYRGEFKQEIQVPPNIYFDRIQSKLSADNILTIIIPKALIPEKIKLEVSYG